MKHAPQVESGRSSFFIHWDWIFQHQHAHAHVLSGSTLALEFSESSPLFRAPFCFYFTVVVVIRFTFVGEVVVVVRR